MASRARASWKYWMGAPAAALVAFGAGCGRATPAEQGVAERSAAPASSSTVSAVPPPPAVDAGVGFGFGSSSSGPGHVSMQVESKDGPKGVDLGPLLGKLKVCYRSSPRRDANEAVRVALDVRAATSGAVTTTATATLGRLVDKGHGEQGYAFADPLPKDDALSTCVSDAAKTAALVVPEASRGTTFHVTIDLSP